MTFLALSLAFSIIGIPLSIFMIRQTDDVTVTDLSLIVLFGLIPIANVVCFFVLLTAWAEASGFDKKVLFKRKGSK
jgi:hypothetical protein